MTDGDKKDKPLVEPVLEQKIHTIVDAAKLPTGKPLANAPSTTTSEEDLEAAGQREAKTLKTSGQRLINGIWEGTQAMIAIMITSAVIYAALNGIESDILSTAFVLVISMYLVRTNHSKVGGVSDTDSR